jgi:transcriptional regulator with XRE-family HTH domain
MLGKYLDKKLREKGWSKNHFAQRCGIAVSSVSRIINGQQTNLTENMKEKIAGGLGVSLRELEAACRDDSLQLLLTEMERISDHLGPVMTARERHQMLSLVNKMKKRIDEQAPPEDPDNQD